MVQNSQLEREETDDNAKGVPWRDMSYARTPELSEGKNIYR